MVAPPQKKGRGRKVAGMFNSISLLEEDGKYKVPYRFKWLFIYFAMLLLISFNS